MSDESDFKPISLETMREVVKSSPFASWLGVRVAACRDGYAEVELDLRREMTQFHGYTHGAIVGGVADVACAWAAASAVGEVVTAEYKVNFLSPAVGEKLVGRGYVIKASSRQVICRSDVLTVTGGQEKLVATALATIVPVNRALNL
ncbi:MAG: PaaI family thioesterase [Thermodesulfobacteriota bacterium]